MAAFTGAGPYDQALGILGLAATDEGVPDEAGASLASMQCDAGDFTFTGECPTPEGAEEPDTTAIALQALLATDQDEAAGHRHDLAARLAGGRRLDQLVRCRQRQQHGADGPGPPRRRGDGCG